MKKYGSDPKGSDVEKLEALEAQHRLASVTFGNTPEEQQVEEREQPQLFGEKEWSPADDPMHDGNYADGRSEDEDI